MSKHVHHTSGTCQLRCVTKVKNEFRLEFRTGHPCETIAPYFKLCRSDRHAITIHLVACIITIIFSLVVSLSFPFQPIDGFMRKRCAAPVSITCCR